MIEPFAYASLILTSALAPLHQAKPVEIPDVIKISNVCISVRHGYEYTIGSNMDYFQVDVSHGGVQAHIYIGYNPQMLDENQKWGSRSLLATLESSKVVPLEGVQTGQFLGVPVRESDNYFHLWFDGDDSAATGPIKEIVGFCG